MRCFNALTSTGLCGGKVFGLLRIVGEVIAARFCASIERGEGCCGVPSLLFEANVFTFSPAAEIGLFFTRLVSAEEVVPGLLRAAPALLTLLPPSRDPISPRLLPRLVGKLA